MVTGLIDGPQERGQHRLRGGRPACRKVLTSGGFRVIERRTFLKVGGGLAVASAVPLGAVVVQDAAAATTIKAWGGVRASADDR